MSLPVIITLIILGAAAFAVIAGAICWTLDTRNRLDCLQRSNDMLNKILVDLAKDKQRLSKEVATAKADLDNANMRVALLEDANEQYAKEDRETTNRLADLAEQFRQLYLVSYRQGQILDAVSLGQEWSEQEELKTKLESFGKHTSSATSHDEVAVGC